MFQNIMLRKLLQEQEFITDNNDNSRDEFETRVELIGTSTVLINKNKTTATTTIMPATTKFLNIENAINNASAKTKS